MSERVALVSGANGFLGSHLVAALRRRGWTVIALVRRGVVSRGDPGILPVQADLSDLKALASAFDLAGGPGAVFHFGARLPRPGREETRAAYARTNVVGTAHLLDLFVESTASVFVYVSSSTVIGIPVDLPISEAHRLDPCHPYSASKLAGEILCEEVRRSAGRRVVSLRLSSPYGIGMQQRTVLPGFIRAALEGRDLTLFGSGRRGQNFTHVDDAVQASLNCLERGKGVYNIGGAKGITMRDLAHLILRLTPGTSSEVVHLEREDPQEKQHWDLDLSLAATDLGYEPRVSLEDGLAAYIAWLRSDDAHLPWWSEE